jgi:hypothetical protein
MCQIRVQERREENKKVKLISCAPVIILDRLYENRLYHLWIASGPTVFRLDPTKDCIIHRRRLGIDCVYSGLSENDGTGRDTNP